MFSLHVSDDLALDLLEERDAEELYALVLEDRAHLERFLPWAKGVTLDGERAFLRQGLQRFARGEGVRCGIRVAGVLAGTVGVTKVRPQVGGAELGYFLTARYEGRGIMTRAVAGLARAMFRERGFRKLEIRCEPDNDRSRRVAERLGFRHEGTLRRAHAASDGSAVDLEVYGLLREEWQGAGQRQEWTA